jgi:hypothetical protein
LRFTAFFAIHQPSPRVAALIVHERRVEEAVILGFELERNVAAVTLGMADGLARQAAAAGRVQP